MDTLLMLMPIVELLGNHFFIPSYQRGYRWTDQQVKDLLNDIWAFAKTDNDGGPAKFYCLQPVAVKRREWLNKSITFSGWEVVDGQQRLTTLFIILRYLTSEVLRRDSLIHDYGKPLYTLYFETRPGSAEFLEAAISESNANIDFYYISKAFKTVAAWFEDPVNMRDLGDRLRFINALMGRKDARRSVQVIWYQVADGAGSIELFTRLNMGKIPLTNAELVKALFLSDASFRDEGDDAYRRKIIISQLWHKMEQQLSDPGFWAFITNADSDNYSSKIELLFEMVADKKENHENKNDQLRTFLYFLEASKNSSLWSCWLEIEQYYEILCQWFKDKDHYHKIGYLVATGTRIGTLAKASLGKKKSEFEKALDEFICDTLRERNNTPQLEELSFDENYRIISNLLLLFNIESVRTNSSPTEYYPFQAHKGEQWSLEHIHAQNSENLDPTKRDGWLQWINYHNNIIIELLNGHLSEEIRANLEYLRREIVTYCNDELKWERFDALSKEVIAAFSDPELGHTADQHSLSNLALLKQPDNAALNNSVFEVKRRAIIDLDKDGFYIPICTRRVFLKYYSDSTSAGPNYFWSKNDKESYLLEISIKLKHYLGY